jgi:outer membrane receptor protein involved in Fe transport
MHRVSLLILFFHLLSNVALTQSVEATLQGKVTTTENEPIPGITVLIENTGKGSITRADGTFIIKGLCVGQHSVIFSGIGYSRMTLPITLTAGTNTINNPVELSEDVSELDEVVVSGKSESTLKREAPIQIESMSIKEVNTQAKDLSGALFTLPGVQVQTSGSLGDAANITLNGLSGQAVRNYIDGLPMEFLYPALSINNLPLVNISRIDVYKGVVPVDVGTDAMAGAINVISDYKSENYFEARYNYGSFNTHQLGLNGGVKLNDKLLLQLNTAYNYSDNNYEIDAEIASDNGKIETIRAERFNDAYELFYTDLSLIVLQNSFFDFAKIGVSYADFYKELNNNITLDRTPWGNYNYDGATSVANLALEKDILPSLKFTNRFAYSFSKLNVVDTSTNVYNWKGEVVRQDSPGEFNNNPTLSERNSDNIINRSILDYSLSDNTQFTLSNLYAYQNIYGADEMKNPENDILRSAQKLEKSIIGLLYTQTLNKFIFNFAGKLYQYQLQGVDTRGQNVARNNIDYGGYGAIKYSFTDQLFLRTSFERGIRIPNASEFFGNGNTITPNSTLIPEESNNVNLELGLSSKNSTYIRWSLQLNGFFRDQKNLVRLAPTEILPKFINQKGVRTLGLELEGAVTLNKKWSYKVNITKFDQTITQLGNSNTNNDLIGSPNPNVQDFVIYNSLEYKNKNIFTSGDTYRLYAQYYFVDTFNYIPVGNFYNPDNWVPSQHRVNLGITYNFPKKRLSISGNVYNILNYDLYDLYSVPRPGRNYNIQIAYKLNNI